MKKVCLAVQDKHWEDVLKELRDLGVMHIESTNAVSDSLHRALEHKTWVEDAIGLLDSYSIPKKVQKIRRRRKRKTPVEQEAENFVSTVLGSPPGEDHLSHITNLVDLIIEADNERQIIEINQLVHSKERDRIASWGDFDPNDIRELAALGYPVYLYEVSPDYLDSIPDDIRYIKINEDFYAARIMTLEKTIPGMTFFELPECRLSQLDAELDEFNRQMEVIHHRMKSYAKRHSQLDREMAKAENRIEYEIARAELVQIDNEPAVLGVSYLKGYVLAENAGKLKTTAIKKGWAFMVCDPVPDDEPPTIMVHNRVVQLAHPIMGFLDLTPGYHEADISGWFLLFFCIFFGMIFGDAGYGLLLFLIAIIGIAKTHRKKIPAVLKLLCILSISNTIWGVLTCSWFGIASGNLPQFFKDISLSYISTVKTDSVIVDQNLKIVCFSLAVVQLSIAHAVNFIRHVRKRSLKLIAEIGSIAMLFGMYNLVLTLVVGNQHRSIPLLPVSPYLIGAGVFLSFLFSYYEGNFLQSILNGLTNIMSVILGATNVFSDIMSYIRLWAVGIAGTAIASIVTGMAHPMLASFLVFAGIIVLIFGHGLNMILNALSVLIHGVRLNTLEFSGHAGVSWSGTPYKPFREIKVH